MYVLLLLWMSMSLLLIQIGITYSKFLLCHIYNSILCYSHTFWLTFSHYHISQSQGAANQCEMWLGPQGAANQFEMWLEESLFLLVLYKGMKTKLGLRRGLKKTFNKWPTYCCPLKRLNPTCCWYMTTCNRYVNTELKVVFPDICSQIYWQ